MQPFKTLTATAVPLRAENVDTDQIIPARYLTAVTKEGMGAGLFSSWRYERDGSPKPDFVLNQPEYQGGEILIAGRNFGSGSSREHAVWALTEYGFRCVITPSFADIFYNNSLKTGLLPVALPESAVNMLLDLVEEDPETLIVVDLKNQAVTLPDGQQLKFDIDPFRRICLLEGLDDLGYILSKEAAIAVHEAAAGVLIAPVRRCYLGLAKTAHRRADGRFLAPRPFDRGPNEGAGEWAAHEGISIGGRHVSESRRIVR